MNDYDKLNEALEGVDDKFLAEAGASKPKKKRKLLWLAPVAAALALVVFLQSGIFPAGTVSPTGTSSPDDTRTPSQSISKNDAAMNAALVSAPEYPEMAPYPEDPNGAYGTEEYNAWTASLRAQYDQPEGYEDGLETFFTEAIPLFLEESEENAVCSPLNIYMALAMLAETTGGDSREAILTALNTDSIESLRTQAGYVWNAHYRADGSSSSLLANSLWLDEGYDFDRSTVTTLSDSYYASVFQGALESEQMNAALNAWLSTQTNGLLDGYLDPNTFDEGTALALASTVLYQAKWHPNNLFWEENNTEGLFHSPSGNIAVTFMNQTQTYGPYYYGEDFGAVRLALGGNYYDGAAMWLILPDEGYEVQDILESGHALGMILGTEEQLSTTIKVHLSLPKFDISAGTDLRSSLTALGLGDLFDPEAADFSAILPDVEGDCLSAVTHAARVAIDEEGVTAAAYTLVQYMGAPLPPEEEVYFTLDQPFLFVITSRDGLPLFAGVVNEP